MLLVVVLAATVSTPVRAQFTDEELAQRETWEEFLASAEIVESEQMGESEGVTSRGPNSNGTKTYAKGVVAR